MIGAVFLLQLNAPYFIQSAQADVVKPALIEISAHRSGKVEVDIRTSIEALLTGINSKYKNTKDSPTAEAYDALRVLPPNQLMQAMEPFRQQMIEQIQLRFDGRKVSLSIEKVEIPPAGYTKVPRVSRITMRSSIPAGGAESLTWYYPAKFSDYAVRVRQVDQSRQKWHWSTWQWIRKDQASEPFSLTEVVKTKNYWPVVASYISIGFFHIVPKGLDHILFIIGIFLFSTRFRPLLWQVTMFTMAHTLTLGLSMTDIISLSPRLVEPLIALSIAWIGIENIFIHSLQRHRLILIFSFGLLHGLGFAGVLTDFGMPVDSFITALISFNVGVELGQLTVILLAFILLGWPLGQRKKYRQYVVVPASTIIAITGLLWTYERIVT